MKARGWKIEGGGWPAQSVLDCASSPSRRARLLCLLGCALIAWLSGEAAVLVVYNNSGSVVAGSLPQRIQENNALGGGNTIVFSNIVTGTITLANELIINTNVIILGPGPQVLTVSANNSNRVFNITGGTANISGLTVANGRVMASGEGGGILNLGTLNISNCLFTANVTSLSSGGAVSSSGNLTVNRCAFINNRAINTSGGALVTGGSASINNSTIVSNSARYYGGGIDSESGGLTLTACTIVGNSAESSGGGIRSSVGSATVRNTIIAGNTAATSGPDVSGTFISEGYNLIGETNGSSGWGAVGDQFGTTAIPLDPKLFPFALYAGSTPAMPPMSGSPAIDQGKSFGLATDQLGGPRTHDQPILNATLGDGTDIGAVEIGPSISLLVTATTDSGAGSLRQATLDASLRESATIRFAPSVTNTIVLTSGELILGTSIELVGPGPRTLTISGNNSSRVFNMPSGRASISGLTIANGEAYPIGGYSQRRRRHFCTWHSLPFQLFIRGKRRVIWRRCLQ